MMRGRSRPTTHDLLVVGRPFSLHRSWRDAKVGTSTEQDFVLGPRQPRTCPRRDSVRQSTSDCARPSELPPGTSSWPLARASPARGLPTVTVVPGHAKRLPVACSPGIYVVPDRDNRRQRPEYDDESGEVRQREPSLCRLHDCLDPRRPRERRPVGRRAHE